MPKFVHYVDFRKWTFGVVCDFRGRSWAFLHLGPLVVGLRKNVPSAGDIRAMWLDEAAHIPQETLDKLQGRLSRGAPASGGWAFSRSYTPIPAAPSEDHIRLVSSLSELVGRRIQELQDTLHLFQIEHGDLQIGIHQIRQERIQEKLDALRKRRTDHENSSDR